MSDFFKKRWVLVAVLIVFVNCKIPHLYYPYYWDESCPYAPAISDMFKHGISLMPNAVDSELSRGHPLFFLAAAATWMHIFGASHIAMHSFALCISVLLLIAIYEAGLWLFDQRVAILSLLLIATQVIFFVQSSFVLLEMLVAFLVFLSLCFYAREKYLSAAICLVFLFYTKESGLVLGVVLGLDAFLSLFWKNISWKNKWYRIASVMAPFALISVFFLLQKHIKGWYIFPLHADIIDYSWKSFWYKFRMCCIHTAFYDGLKFYYFLPLLVLAIIAAIKDKNARFLIILIPAICIYYFVSDKRAGRLLPSVPFFIVFVSSALYFLCVYSRKFFVVASQRRFIVLAGGFILCFLCFSTINFFTPRYLLAAIVPLLFITAVFIVMLARHTYPILYFSVIAMVLLISFFSFKTDEGYGDTNLGAFTGMDIQQVEVSYLEQNNAYDKAIGAGSYLTQQHLTNSATGFLHSGKSFTNVKWDISHNTDFVLFDNIESDYRYEAFKKDTQFHLVYKNSRKGLWTEIYQHN